MITFDCLHDMTRPAQVIAAFHRALRSDGTWLIKDIRSQRLGRGARLVLRWAESRARRALCNAADRSRLEPFRAGRDESRRRSRYILFFPLPGIAGSAPQKNDWRMFREWVGNYRDVEDAIRELSRPGRLTAAPNWYGANFDPAAFCGDAPYSAPGIQCDAMGIWGTGEKFLTKHQMLGSPAFVAGKWRYERIAGASHWVQHDKPDAINRLLLDFLQP
jgi:pimeloyl-ACP methyl ester carboxylesterase